MTFYCLETKKGQVIINLSQVSYITFDKNGFTVYMNDGNYFYCVEYFADFVDNFEIRNK